MKNNKTQKIKNSKLNNLSLRWKLNLFGIGIILIFTLAFVFVGVPLSKWIINEGQKQKLNESIQEVQGTIESYQYLAKLNSGDSIPPLPLQAIQNNVLELIEKLNQGKNHFFFVLDSDGYILMHPTLPQIIGQNFTDLESSPFNNNWPDDTESQNFLVEYDWHSTAPEIKSEPATILGKQYVPWDWIICISIPTQNLASSTDEIVLSITLVTLGASIVALIFLFITSNVISKPTESITYKIQNIIINKDFNLTQPINYQSTDEIGLIAHAFDQLITKLQDLTHQITDTSQSIISEITELSTHAEDIQLNAEKILTTIELISEGSHSQSQQTGKIFIDSARITEVSDQVYQSANEAKKTAEDVMNSSQLGEEAMTNAMGKFNDLYQVSVSASEVVKELSEKSHSIGTIVQTISNISRQVNLLALNAAIEAAHAGDAGRGFEVVAEEIRRLASQTNDATEKIAEIISQMEEATIKTVEYSDAVTERLQEGETAINHTNSILKEIATETKKSTEATLRIGELVSSQKQMVQAFVQSMEGIVEIAEMNAIRSEEIDASTQQQTSSLNLITTSLNNILNRLKQISNQITKSNSQ